MTSLSPSFDGFMVLLGAAQSPLVGVILDVNAAQVPKPVDPAAFREERP